MKPGDFGEVTFSLHLCDNPGYIWMNGELQENAQNGYTDPERETLEEEGWDERDFDANDDDWGGQLADELRVRMWYDENCNNVYEPEGEEVEGDEIDLTMVIDVSGSMSISDANGTRMEAAQDGAKILVDTLGTNDQASLVTFETDADRPFDLTLMDNSGKDDIKDEIDGLQPLSLTNTQGGIIFGAEELVGDDDYDVNTLGADITTPSSNARSGVEKVMVVLADGESNRHYDENGDVVSGDDDPAAIAAANAAKDEGIRIFTIAIGEADEDFLEDVASDPDDAYTADNIGELEDVFADIGQVIQKGERLIFEGPFSEAMDLLETDNGIPLDGRPDTPYEEIIETEEGYELDDGVDENRGCFVNSVTKCIGFEWWLPTSIGNEVQSDSVAFDLGFYTEQCRHNDGSGNTTTS